MESKKNNKEIEDRLKEVLICKVEQLPGLYDKSNPQYKDTKWKTAMFCLIAQEIGCTPLEAQTWWKSLRDSFTAENRVRQSESASGSRADKRKQFRFYNAMTFLIPFARKRRSLSTVSEVLADEVTAASVASEEEATEESEWESIEPIQIDCIDNLQIGSVDSMVEIVEEKKTPVVKEAKSKPLQLPVLSPVKLPSNKAKKDAELTDTIAKAITSLDKALNTSNSGNCQDALLGQSITSALQSISDQRVKLRWKRKFRDMLGDMEAELLDQ